MLEFLSSSSLIHGSAFTVGEFKSRFSEALEAVRRGESITVTFGRKKQAVAIVSPVPAEGTKRPLGLLAGKARVAIADDWEINESQFLGTPTSFLTLAPFFGWSLRLSG